MSPKIVFDFFKTKTSLAASEYLMGLYNPTDEEDSTELKDNLLKAIQGKYKSACNSICSVFQSGVDNISYHYQFLIHKSIHLREINLYYYYYL